MNEPLKVELINSANWWLPWLPVLGSVIAAVVALRIAATSAKRKASQLQVEKATEAIALLALMEARFRGTYARLTTEIPATAEARKSTREAVSDYNRRWGQSVELAWAQAYAFLQDDLYKQFVSCHKQATAVLTAMTGLEDTLAEDPRGDYATARQNLRDAVNKHWAGVYNFLNAVRTVANTKSGLKRAEIPTPEPPELTEDLPPSDALAEPEPPSDE
ncbi:MULTISPECIES: hypothetical protein [Tsukamurella]|uniref:Uncharacterized protein n=2 Tax=Tsukamurella TaxID=2060 RepID=A0A5C5S2A8_9ACTN|nr:MULTISPECIES: hypothetical protein [Tsukamurella]NMD54925.1 hypothetical protein [Tsukamurella columbiensis]TWS29537.1 hypothetical protein FK530_08430 [Tsukamurella conjunctivitidis]